MNGPDTAPLFVMSESSHGDTQPLGTVVENSQSKHRVEPSDLDLGKECPQLATRSD
jgi:hypothetical protein